MRKENDVFDSARIWRATAPPEWITAGALGVDAWGERSNRPPVAGPFRMLRFDYSEAVEAGDSSALAAELANLELTEEAIAEFVQRLGYLGVDQPWFPGDGSHNMGMGEQFNAWVEAVTVFRVVFHEINGRAGQRPEEGFTLASVGEPFVHHGQLYRRHRWTIDSDVYHANDDRNAFSSVSLTEARPEGLPMPLFSAEFIAPVDPDWATPTHALSHAIAYYTSRLVGIVPETDESGDTTLIAVPRNLLGSAWLQLATDLANDGAQYRKCPAQGCRNWYRKVRDDQRTCGNSTCRGKRFNARRDRARALHESGIDSNDIATQLSEEFDQTVEASDVDNLIAASKKRRKKVSGVSKISLRKSSGNRGATS